MLCSIPIVILYLHLLIPAVMIIHIPVLKHADMENGAFLIASDMLQVNYATKFV